MHTEDCSIVIATRNRPEALKDCLDSLHSQTKLPREVILVDSSDNDQTEQLSKSYSMSPVCLQYIRSNVRSAAVQRNLGAARAKGIYLVFFDDDVVVAPDFLAEIERVFAADRHATVGGVGGIIEGCSYSDLSFLNRLLLSPAVSPFDGSFAGRILGPAVNFAPADHPGAPAEVDWLMSGCAAFRTHVFLRYRFGESFQGYSFAEDVHLSARIAKRYRLLVTNRARVVHKALRAASATNWRDLGEMIVVNRHEIMTNVLGYSSRLDVLRLAYYELVYCTLAVLWARHRQMRMLDAWQFFAGKIEGFRKVLSGRSPHVTGAAGPHAAL